ncbi:MAG: ribonuclease H-like domain-containing protein [Candidatus Hydrogenedentales bacterium]|jgi:uncharacterized protein YprB with RNaseH-like and TPR domain
MNDNKKIIEELKESLPLTTANMLPPAGGDEDKTAPKKEASSTSTPASSSQTEKPSESGSFLTQEKEGLLSAFMGSGRTSSSAEPDTDTDAGEYPPLSTLVHGEIHGDDDFGFFHMKKNYPLTYHVGEIPLSLGLQCRGEQLALSACDKGLKDINPLKSCYIDTETTGLAGGAGTAAFLIGLGYYRNTGFVLEQCFMRDYDDEGAVLAYLAEKFLEFDCLVSFNGKSFDLPLLRARFVQHRLNDPFEHLAHYDLVHAVRRVWKQRLGDCSLKNIERSVLDFHRVDDVPGFAIPNIWFYFLDTGDPRALPGVFEHNALDIVSLGALAGHLSESLAASEGSAFYHAEDRLSVIRLYYKNKEYKAVVEQGQQFLDKFAIADDLRRECLHLTGQSWKRLRRFDEMFNTWKMLHEEFPKDCVGAAELAKFLEHQFRNPKAAAEICEESLQAIERSEGIAGLSGDYRVSTLRGRLNRLRAKIEKQRKPKQWQSGDIFED